MTRGADDKAAALRALLDENGLPGVEVEHTPTGISVHTDGWVHAVVRADGTLITPTDEGDIDDVIAALHNQMYDDANTALRALGLPSAAEVRALVAEVERLRAGVAGARWYSYNPGGGYDEHDTEAEAREYAERSIDERRADAQGDGWDPDTGCIEYGMMVPVARAVETDRVETPDGPHDFYCDYALLEVPRG